MIGQELLRSRRCTELEDGRLEGTKLETEYTRGSQDVHLANQIVLCAAQAEVCVLAAIYKQFLPRTRYITNGLAQQNG